MKKLTVSFLCLVAVMFAAAQSYTSYLTGSADDVVVQPTFGIALAGGGGDNDQAMQWFLSLANGGDVVVLRASGADGYNDYFYSELGVDVNSVETIVFENGSASEDPYVLDQLANAEAIFIAGGDQWNYVSYWRDTPVEDALNNHTNVKQGAIGGTSAGMAILGGHYFTAENGTVYSDEALENPFNNYMTIGHHDFLQTPFLHDVITDTHYDDPDRRGRHATMLARIYADGYPQALGIACEEFTCVCIDEFGLAHVYGEYPDYDDYAFFLRHGCNNPWTPEECVDGEPLNWIRDETALYVLRSPGTTTGVNIFSLTDWLTWNGGDWQEWWIEEGVLNVEEVSFGPSCPLDEVTSVDTRTLYNTLVYPNPASDVLTVQNTQPLSHYTIYSVCGEMILSERFDSQFNYTLDIKRLPAGIYTLTLFGKNSKSNHRFIKQ